MIRFLRPGNWSPSQVQITWSPNTRQIIPEVETAIDIAWEKALARPGVHLFDGPMCRLESWTATDDHLALTISKSDYKAFLGTNMAHPEFVAQFGPQVMANPVGVSPALLTSDRHILMGRRTANVAYYPSRVHPFAGCMEPTDADPFAAILRELHEELSLAENNIDTIRLTGIAEDTTLRQPELIFAATTSRSRAQVQASLDPVEHHSIWAIPATSDAVANAAENEQQLTPVAVAALLLWGRVEFGQEWFDASAV